MSAPSPSSDPSWFTWKGWDIRLREMRDGSGSPIWVAEIDGTDLIHVMGARADEDPERIKHMVRDWIDDGMPRGGMSA